MKDFFISYNRADRTWAEWIAWQLEAEGYSVVIQAWDFRPGGNFVLDMQSATEEAARTIAVLSPDYLISLFTAPEWAAAFAQDPTGKEGKLLPVRVRECKLRGLLSQIVYIDLVDLDEEAAKRDLLDGINRNRTKPKTEPNFPGSLLRAIPNEPNFPGSVPAIWNIPHLHNPNFTGREDELAELRASLMTGETALVQAQAIHGLSGIGKTQLAIEYVYRYGSDYDVIWWIRSEDLVTLSSDYASLATKLDLPEKDLSEQQAVVEAVKEWLRKHSGWLLIFDNAEDLKSVRDYIPRGGMGHIIFTSRNPNWAGIAKPLSITSLLLDNAVEFLLKRTGSRDEAAAKSLAEAVGCLPLALEQASAYVETSGCGLAHYLDLFEKYKNRLLQHGNPSAEYPATVATTWNISFQNVERDNPSSTGLLRLCAFFAPDDIRLIMITGAAAGLPEELAATARDPFLFDEALTALRKYSLIEVKDEKISIHRLVQTVIRHSLNEEDFKLWAKIAVHIADAFFPEDSNDVRTWPICTALLPHALMALSHAEAVQITSEEISRLLNQIGVYLHARAEYTWAKIMYERAIAIDEVTVGLDHPSVATVFNNLGRVLEVQSDFDGAEALYRRAITISTEALGHWHPKIATLTNNLGGIYEARGDLDTARILYQRALQVGEASLGSNHPEVTTYANNLGTVLKMLGDLKSATALFERALAISEAAFGPDHPQVAILINNLGIILDERGDLEGAKILYERSLAITEAAFGPNHPEVATRLSNLGLVLKAQGDLAGAKALHERALAIQEETFGFNHPQVAMALNNLSIVLESQGDLAGAKTLLLRAIRIGEPALGRDHYQIATLVSNLAGVLKAQGDFESAKILYERAMATSEAIFGPNHSDVAVRLNNLGGVLQAQGDLKGAKALYERALQIFQENFGDDHPDTKKIQNNFRWLEEKMKKAE